jgi:hypothetical protein
MNDNISLASTKLVIDALRGEQPNLIQWALLNFRGADVVAAKQLADEVGCDFEDILGDILYTDKHASFDNVPARLLAIVKL